MTSNLTDQIVELRGQAKRQREVAERLDMSRSRVANLERVRKGARPEWLAWVADRRLSLKHLEAVITLAQTRGDLAEGLLRKAMAQGWSASTLRAEVKVAKGERRPEDPHANADVAHVENTLSEMLATRVFIRTKPDGGGDLVLTFTDNDTLDGLLQRLGYVFE